MTFERKFEVEIFFRDQLLIVYAIRLIAIREVSPPVNNVRALLRSNRTRQLTNKPDICGIVNRYRAVTDKLGFEIDSRGSLVCAMFTPV